MNRCGAINDSVALRVPGDGKGLRGEVTVPGDKSISHRAAFLGALSSRGIRVSNFAPGDDCSSTLRCLSDLGFEVQRDGETVEVRTGSGPVDPIGILDAGNSGTTARLLCGLLAPRPGLFGVVTGDPSLLRRPMDRVVEPLRSLGARIEGPQGGRRLPLAIRGSRLSGGRVELKVKSAQVKTALILSALSGSHVVVVQESAPTRDHTEVMLQHLGVPLKREGGCITVYPCHDLPGGSWRIPSDPSSAAFWAVGSAVLPASDLMIPAVGVNPGRVGFIKVLQRMGCPVEVAFRDPQGGEVVGDIRVRHSSLRAVEVEPHEVPGMVDELPVLAVAAALAEGVSRIRGAQELRHKECDRIRAVAECLNAIGGRVRELEDGWEMEGVEMFDGGDVDSFGDHRIAMAMGIAALRCRSTVTIRGAQCVSVSYPGFFERLEEMIR
ncbi:3-phosphoshikimate 1-carboxyvinyltransferase [Thermanaerovibrio velox DSM 12556]|uniref:3-phosphoshikimate 1-carboxyvinyltransferase n=1 Tax=Thermanaerovibrio velox DSM 12556 TaxID=926567 RepID=H0UNF2_9BACT|nr:3-phosphoshikimate 1-carboxyvinyltransferase [Thermanaerovibrio velox]EHM09359.1 3-phosphoshikimate 1-carboxyvinyltransferase [Thermanaerovibrio velox DSM 12556]